MRRLFLILCLLLVVTALGSGASLAQSKLDASILSYDGNDFFRPATVFGKNYQANYAPLTGADGKLTGALFVGAPK